MKGTKTTISTCCNQKGGAGKTTTVYHLIYDAVRRGMRVLAIDTDGQASLTKTVGLYDEEKADLADWAINHDDVRIAHPDGFDFIPSTPSGVLALMRELQEDTVSPSGYFREALKLYAGCYDIVVFDTPPAVGLLLTNALMASNRIIIPLQAEYLAADGFVQMQKTIDRVRRANPDLEVTGAIITQYNPQASEHEIMGETAAAVAHSFGSKVFDTRVRISTKVAEKQRKHANPYSQLSRNKAAQDYRALFDELFGQM